MIKKKPLLLALLLCALSQWVMAAVNPNMYRFNRIDVAKGLSNSEVKCIYKDRAGFMWFGTPSGLNRYDGYEVVAYKRELSEDSSKNANNDIWRIQEDADGRLWLTTRSGYAVYNPAQERFENDTKALFQQYAGVDDFWSMYIDLGKNLWFVTWDDVRLYDWKTGHKKIFTQGEPEGLSRGLIADIRQGKNRYWFLFDNGLLECMDAQTHKIISRDTTLQQKLRITNDNELRLFVDSSGDVWVYGGSHYGVACYSAPKNDWQFYATTEPQPYRLSSDIVVVVEEDNKGHIWVGTDHGGVNLVDKKNKVTTVVLHDEHDTHSLSQNTIKSLYRDDSDIMWLGTYKKGVCYFHESIFKFKAIASNVEIPYSDVNCFYETPEGNVWIGTNGGGLLYFDRARNRFTEYKRTAANPNSPAGDVIVSLATDPAGRLWIGYYLEGLDCFDGKTFVHYDYDPQHPDVLTDNNAWKLLTDKAGNLWVGTLRGGVLVINTTTGKRIRHMDADGAVYAIVEQKSGQIMVGSQGGLYQYNAATEQLELYEKDIFTKIQLARYDINQLYEDSRGLIWIGTRNGLFVYNPYTKEVRLFREENGLSSDLIQSILEDADHNMWIATNRGLTCMKVSTANDTPGYFYHLVNYDRSEGLQGEQFNYNAAYITAKSELIFGGSSGFNIFTPSGITYNKNVPKVVLTDFQLYNRSIRPGERYDGRTILSESISNTRELTLNYTDNYFTLSFAALDYCMPDKSRYFYKLEGFNNQWLETDKESRKVTYTNLNPGRYTFYLKAMNNDGVESGTPVVLTIHVRPPFWQTIWAYLVYIVLLTASLFAYRRHLANKQEMKLKYAREKMQITQQHEMDEMKLRFFTNISHEFRTPLTLILTPLEELLKKVSEPDEKESLSIMRRNTRQLLLLVNQLLDFRKLDVKGHALQYSSGDIVQFAKDEAELFAEAMSRKQIAFTFATELSDLYMEFDADKLAKVLVNVLSNAHKFTPVGGRIGVDLSLLDNDRVAISIADSGVGIPAEELEKVFERFYQVKSEGHNYQGSGIGLHLAKEFVTLHKGQIWAEQVPEGGSRFVIVLPVRQEGDLVGLAPSSAEDGGSSHKPAASAEESYINDGHLPKLLIVDDNDDFRTFLAARFKEQYVVLEACDGVVGLDIALKEIPDMILSDVMMPRMNGVEMGKAIKADIRTSHIPLILLTAKSGEESKLEGLTAGADDYITKPFNMDILMVKLHNLVEARRKNQQLFGEQIRIEPSKITVSSLDEKLIKKALEYTEANISNPDYSVEELSRDLGMSRVHLYKKLSSLTGKTPIEFIRVVRLKRAAQLLQESQLTVAEIAYEVGFNSPKYFRKYFKDEFGVLPSQYGSRNE